jgi:hypothetical protein
MWLPGHRRYRYPARIKYYLDKSQDRFRQVKDRFRLVKDWVLLV